MDHQIIKKESFNIIGFKQRISLLTKDRSAQTKGEFPRPFFKSMETLRKINNIEPTGFLYVAENIKEYIKENKEVTQYIGVATTNNIEDDFDSLKVDASLWAVFNIYYSTQEELENSLDYIYNQWLNKSDYRLNNGPELLEDHGLNLDVEMYYMKIWIPIVNK